MSDPDLNLLVTLDVLLDEGNVANAARRLGLSASAMSRSLARLREATGDPLLVRAGRGLVPTPRALELRERTGRLVKEAQALLRPAEALDLSRVKRSFTLRNRDGFVENFGADLIARVHRDAPGIQLIFVPKTDRDSTPLRDGSVDLETGVIGFATGPEVRAQALFRDRLVGVVAADHPFAEGEISAERYAGGRHVVVSRSGQRREPIDDALDLLSLKRDVAAVVGGFSEALSLVRGSDMIANVPERYTGRLRGGLFTFALPFAMPERTISLLWHPRMDADAAHRWLRGLVREICTAARDPV